MSFWEDERIKWINIGDHTDIMDFNIQQWKNIDKKFMCYPVTELSVLTFLTLFNLKGGAELPKP